MFRSLITPVSALGYLLPVRFPKALSPFTIFRKFMMAPLPGAIERASVRNEHSVRVFSPLAVTCYGQFFTDVE